LNEAPIHRDLVTACQRQQPQAQSELYQRYAKAMYNICLRMLRDPLDAEDALQNAFVEVFRHLHTFRFDCPVGAWIKRIVVNTCINTLKKKRVRFEPYEDHHADIPEPELSEPHTLPVETVKQALYDLPDGYRIVFSLYALEGYDHQEIADILHISEATSKSQYSRARRKLKEIIHSRTTTANTAP